jgi:hypothetical protein
MASAMMPFVEGLKNTSIEGRSMPDAPKTAKAEKSVAAPAATSAPIAPSPPKEERQEARAPIEPEDRLHGELVLTVKVRRFLFFAVTGVEVSIITDGKLIDRITTDSRGQALFQLPPGPYVVQVKDRRVPIHLMQHGTLRIKFPDAY